MGGDAMVDSAGGHFDRVLEIEARGGVWLHGPLELADDQRLSKLFIWLWQTPGDGPGGAATAVLNGARFNSAAARRVGGAEWRTRADAIYGELRAGPATGMALAILERGNGSTDSYWWSDSNIRLEEGVRPKSVPATDVSTKLAEVLRALADTIERW